MPVQRMGGKAAFLAAVARLAADLLAHHVAQHAQALLRAPLFGFIDVVIDELMENAHRRMTLQLASHVVLRGVNPFPLFEDLRQHQIGRRAGIFLRAAAQKCFPLVGFP